ncbi:hypothetical protein [Microbacterium sp. NPDC076911]|uniref:hypothetical protein n=1 Tax=Microbacterium sp. NPDC076911 TaxID=3154958 RepID=UPI003425B1DF
MKRIEIVYGGERFSIGDRDLETLKQEIRAGLATGHHWLVVNDGEGDFRSAYLSISPGVPLALIPVPQQEPSGDTEEWDGLGTVPTTEL